MARECAIIPDNFKTGISGAELLKVGIQCAEDAGFKWPGDWQRYIADTMSSYAWVDVVPRYEGLIAVREKYRINPERLKPKAPIVDYFIADGGKHIKAIELTDQVRRRLGKDAVVDTKNLTHVITTCRNVNLSSKDITSRIMELIEAAAVEVKE